jgi:type 1 glutamine amidotransferase
MLLLAGLLLIPKHVVLLAGDEEYRSEEMLPQLAQILTKRHGFKCTVVYSLNGKGEIDPEERRNQPGIEALDTADVCVMMLRFREWPDAQMRHFVDYYRSGKPILAIRTSTHAFNYAADSTSPYKEFANGFGKQVLGETWVSHWGNHGSQATRGHIVSSHPVLRGVQDLFGTTDVYEAAPPADAEILVRGEVVAGLKPSNPAASGRKKTAKGVEQELNDPMMPIVWSRRTPNQILTTTMGAATDFLNPGYRRLLVNGVYWLSRLPIPASADVALVGTYEPSAFGFGGFRKGIRP